MLVFTFHVSSFRYVLSKIVKKAQNNVFIGYIKVLRKNVFHVRLTFFTSKIPNPFLIFSRSAIYHCKAQRLNFLIQVLAFGYHIFFKSYDKMNKIFPINSILKTSTDLLKEQLIVLQYHLHLDIISPRFIRESYY